MRPSSSGFAPRRGAVAALNHPNILQVYDWGEQDGEPYLVLEYLAGGSLRQVYDTGVLLTPEQAVRIGLDAAAGLDYAHRRGVIHRDIKPANLLLDADRRLHIADFGLARALAEAAWTEPDGAILGTARYAAPEQVEGWVLDGKADVYALALVLYEGVTGQTPFVGDTTVATLMARVGALLPEHPALGPLNDVLVWAAAPDPAERFDAAQLALRLQALSVALPEAEPLPIDRPTAPVEPIGPDDATVHDPLFPPVGAVDDLTDVGAPDPAAAVGRRARQRAARRALVAEPAAGPATAPKEPEAKEAEDAEFRVRRRWPWIVAVIVLVAALVAGGVVAAVETKLFVPSHPVPSLVAKTLPEARRAVAADHFTIKVAGVRDSITVPAGLVISQQPSSGRGAAAPTAKEGSTIAVVVSAGPPPVAIPDLTSFANCNDAIKALAAVHLVGVCPVAAALYSSTVVAGAVLDTSPHGSAPYGSTVTVITSKGHAPVAIPSVTGAGSSWASASAALSAAGFVAAETTQYSASVPSGQVIATTPDASTGAQPFGSTVAVAVSLGPQPVNVPDVTGESLHKAEAALSASGLQVGGPYGPSNSNTVVSTSPSAGTSVLPGSTVNVYTK